MPKLSSTKVVSVYTPSHKIVRGGSCVIADKWEQGLNKCSFNLHFPYKWHSAAWYLFIFYFLPVNSLFFSFAQFSIVVLISFLTDLQKALYVLAIWVLSWYRMQILIHLSYFSAQFWLNSIKKLLCDIINQSFGDMWHFDKSGDRGNSFLTLNFKEILLVFAR